MCSHFAQAHMRVIKRQNRKYFMLENNKYLRLDIRAYKSVVVKCDKFYLAVNTMFVATIVEYATL